MSVAVSVRAATERRIGVLHVHVHVTCVGRLYSLLLLGALIEREQAVGRPVGCRARRERGTQQTAHTNISPGTRLPSCPTRPDECSIPDERGRTHAHAQHSAAKPTPPGLQPLLSPRNVAAAIIAERNRSPMLAISPHMHAREHWHADGTRQQRTRYSLRSALRALS